MSQTAYYRGIDAAWDPVIGPDCPGTEDEGTCWKPGSAIGVRHSWALTQLFNGVQIDVDLWSFYGEIPTRGWS